MSISPETMNATDITGTFFSPVGTEKLISIRAKFAQQVNATDYGAVFDGITNDTVALQNAINATQSNTLGGSGKTLILPAGTSVIGGVTISGQIDIRGSSSGTSVLSLASGSTVPAVTISVANVSTTQFAAQVSLSHLRIVSPNRADGPGQSVAHGVALVNAGTPVQTRVLLTDVTIGGVPGDGVHAASWTGWVEADGVYIQYPGGYGLYANSVSDWRWKGGDISGALSDNVILSGSAAMQFVGTNIYAAVGNNVQLFGATQASFALCYFDIAGKHGIWNQLNSSGSAVFNDCWFRWSSQSATGTYFDAYFEASSGGSLYFNGGHFKSGASPYSPFYTPQGNIGFSGSSAGTAVLTPSVVFDGGVPTASGQTNLATQLSGAYLIGIGGVSPITTRLRADATTAYTAPAAANGGTTTMAQGQEKVLLLPSGPIAGHTLNLPLNPEDGQVAKIASSNAITTLTVAASGKTVTPSSTTLAAGQGIEYTYVAGGTSWVKSI